MTREPLRIDVPAVVRAKAASARGGAGWAEDLPGLVTRLEGAWSMTLTEVLPGGTSSFVARGLTDDGHQVVLKVAAPGTRFDRQVDVLSTADGDGFVRVLRHAPEHDAVLLEALGAPLAETGLTPPEQLETMARLLRRAWRVSPSPALGAPEDKAAGLAALITDLWRDLEHPCSDAVFEHALSCAGRRSAAFTGARCVVVHGDAACANAARVLQPRPGTEGGFVMLDPDGFVGDPAYDLGVALRDWCTQLLQAPSPASLLGEYCTVLAREAGADAVAVWEWGFLERVSTGLYALSLGAHEHADPLLRSAEALLADGAPEHLSRHRRGPAREGRSEATTRP